MAKTNFIQNTLLDTGELLKRCSTCGELKSLEEFYVKHRRAQCKNCHSEKQKRFYEKYPEKRQAQNAKYIARHSKRRDLKRKYNLTVEEYDRMVEFQRGACAICGKQQTVSTGRCKNPNRLSVDHDHETGALRALLCHHCNVGLGHFNDDPDMLRRAINYIDSFRKAVL